MSYNKATSIFVTKSKTVIGRHGAVGVLVVAIVTMN